MTQTRRAFLNERFRRAAVLCVLILGAGLFLSSTTRAAESPLRPVVLQLRWHHQFQFAGYYVAKELGFYREAGLDVEIRPGGRDVSPVTEVLAGRADFGIDGSGLLVERAQGRPVVAVAAIFQKSPLRLIARVDRGIRRIEDLAGRRVMLLPGFRSLALLAMLDQTGMLDRVVRVNSSADIDDLIHDQTDAFNAYNSNEPFVLKQAGVAATVFDPTAYGIQFYSDVLFASESTADDRSDLVTAFRAASLRGWLYALDNPDRAIDLIERAYPTGKTRAHLAFEAEGIRESVMADVVEIGHMSELRWGKIRDQLSAIGLVPHDMPLDRFVFRPDADGLSWENLQPYMALGSVALALVFAVTAIVIRKNVQLQDMVEDRTAAEQRAQHLATHDYLTGLPNRMLLLDRLDGALARARRHRHTPLLAFIDLDNFKQLNDQCGHQRGDDLLVAIAGQARTLVREEDTFARMGGDEFVLLADHMPPLSAPQEAERLMLAVLGANTSLQLPVKVTASIGLLSVEDAEGLTADLALRLVDDLMYEVKHANKNGCLIRIYRHGGLHPLADATPTTQEADHVPG